jgi:hypothetical protein
MKVIRSGRDSTVPSGGETLADELVASETTLCNELIALDAGDTADMLELAPIAKPRPFGPRT